MLEAMGIATPLDAFMWLAGALVLACLAAHLVNLWRYEQEAAADRQLADMLAREQMRRDRRDLIRAHFGE